jgi:ribokinase
MTLRAAVVGHVEWAEFLRVDHLPIAGEIVHASESWEAPGGAGAGAAVQLRKLAGESTFFTAVGDDELGDRATRELEEMGVRVEAAVRRAPMRRAVTHIDSAGERTITVVGERLAPHGDDDLPWENLRGVDVAYFTAGDADALRMARRARVLVATSRVLSRLKASGVALDALVGSAEDPAEAFMDDDLDPRPGLLVRTRGAEGGSYSLRGGPPRTFRPSPPPGPVVDRYGAGDSFAAALGYALALEMPAEEALELAARCGAAVLAGRGPYEGQLSASELGAGPGGHIRRERLDRRA